MGIPRFQSRLESYAAQLEVRPRDGTETNHGLEFTNIIIDGPSFVFQVYGSEFLELRSARNALQKSVDYRAIGEKVLEWLEAIEEKKVRISAIYFDGGLPASKRNERLSRLQSQYTKLHTVKKQLSESQDCSNIHYPAFLVPAVAEVLRASKYHEVVSVVEGEADHACAAYARENDGVILTSDSDLLIHYLGEYKGSVVYLKDIAQWMPYSFGHPENHTVTSFDPSIIRERLGLRSLIPLAYEMYVDANLGAQKCAIRARAMEDDPLTISEVEEFAKNYQPTTVQTPGTDWLAAHADPTPDQQPSAFSLDARISEFLTASLPFSNSPQKSLQTDEEGPAWRMYLPFLSSDPDSAISPWAPGTNIRQLAYSIILLLHPSYHKYCDQACVQPLQVREIGPLPGQKTIGGTPITLLSPPAVIQAVVGVLQIWERLDIIFPSLCEPEAQGAKWKARILHTLLSLFVSASRCPTRSEVEALLRPRDMQEGAEERDADWRAVHLAAEYQATYYSYRVLSQCLSVFLAFCKHSSCAGSDGSDYRHVILGYYSTIEDLGDPLKFLPSLSEINDPWDEELGDPGEIVGTIMQELGLEGEVGMGRKEKKRRKREREQGRGRGKMVVGDGWNAFALLGDEMEE